MTDFGTMKARIADEVDDSGADLTTQIARAIQSAIKHHERRRFYFNTTVTATFALVAGQEYYGSADNSSIPDLIEIRDMYFAHSDGTRQHLTPVPWERIAAAADGVSRADPAVYCYHAQKIRVLPMPSAARTVTASWVYRLTALSADADTNAWMTDAEELIRLRAEIILARDVTKDDAEITRLAPWEAQALADLEAETRRRRGTPIMVNDMMSGGRGYDIATDSW